MAEKIFQNTKVGDYGKQGIQSESEPIDAIIYSKPFSIAKNLLDIFYIISQAINEHTNIIIQEFMEGSSEIQVQKYSFKTDSKSQGGCIGDELQNYINLSKQRKAQRKKSNNCENFFFFRFSTQLGQIDQWKEKIESIRFYKKQIKLICRNYLEKKEIKEDELYIDFQQRIKNVQNLQPKQLHDIIFI